MLFHFAFFLRQYKGKTDKDYLQKFFDYFFRQIELSIREIGYGDVSINKKMKDYINILFSIIDKLDKWEFIRDVEKKKILSKYINEDKDTEKYLIYFEKYSNFLAKNTFKNLSKDILSL